jgi:hypothetical protein
MGGMKRSSSDELHDLVWKSLVKHKGDRAKVAEELGKSERTLNRYIADLNLYAAMDKAGLIRNPGPPRGVERGTSAREEKVVSHIRKNKGEIDYGELAVEMYAADNEKTRQRVYTTLGELKGKGVIALDGQRWFIV